MPLKIQVNPDAEVFQGDFAPVQAGDYTVRVQFYEERPGTKGPYWVYKLAIITPKESLMGLDGQPLDGLPSTVFHNVFLGEKAQGRLRALVEATGGTWGDEVSATQFDGAEIQVRLKLHSYTNAATGKTTLSNDVVKIIY